MTAPLLFIRSLRPLLPRLAPLGALLLCAACGGGPLESDRTGTTGSSSSGGSGDIDLDVGGEDGTNGNGYCGSSLTGTLRDFTTSHPDFEYVIEVDPGIVQGALGADGKPVYAGPASGTPTTHGEAYFDQWYRDVQGVNQTLPFTLSLKDMGGGLFTYDNSAFFPIDDAGFGNQGNPHNYHFTFELHTKFQYRGGEVFTFTGDDDLFTFINGRLAIDLGGVHGAMSQSIDLDARSEELGLTPGGIYSLDFFFAERHLTESNFRIDTTIASFVDCGTATPK